MNTNKSNITVQVSCTSNIAPILKQLQSSIIFTTYQSNKIISISQKNDKIDIQYSNFPRPMGMCFHKDKIFAGLGHSIYQFNKKTLTKDEDHDVCYVPRNIHITGDIDIHEMEFCKNELYFINTKFSCLCTKDLNSSFKVFWKPPFISVMQPVDQCHLNGFCSQDGEPRYITALATTNTPLGWRKHKKDGGILMDIKTNTILAEGLSMPHSPRWYNNTLYILESGKGSISYYDFQEKKVKPIAKVPGFTRGMDIIGNLAFIGVSKVRESATFSGLEITKLKERVCGIWIVDLNTKKTLGNIDLKSGIDEIFAVNILPNKKPKLVNHTDDLSKSFYFINSNDFKDIKMPETKMETAVTHFDKGNDLFNGNKIKAAIKEYKKALEIDKDYLPATLHMGIAFTNLKEFKKAESILKEVIQRDASIVDAYNFLGFICHENNRLNEAKEYYTIALKLYPENIKAEEALKVLDQKLK